MGALFIVSAPSGAGKTSLIKALVKKLPNIEVSVSMTTRKSRDGEIDGVNYFFVDKATFKKNIQRNNFLEYAKVFDNYYGTPKDTTLNNLANNKDIILEIDWQGAALIKQNFLQATSIFILPPDIATLKQRLISRGQNSSLSINNRISQALCDIKKAKDFDYLVMNDNFDKAVLDLQNIVSSNKLKFSNQQNLYEKFIR